MKTKLSAGLFAMLLVAGGLSLSARADDDASVLTGEVPQVLTVDQATPVSDCGCDTCSGHGRRPLMRGRRAGCGGCGSCGGGCAAGMGSAMCAGQPLIDPHARADWIAMHRAAARSWHAGYYHTQYGAPVALVVPPTARMQTRMGWGVSQTTMSPIYHQFERPYPGPVAGAGAGGGAYPLLATPRWPSHTDQFGVYYVRGPW